MEPSNRNTMICNEGLKCPDRINNKCKLLHLPPQDLGGKKPSTIPKPLPGFC